MIFDISILSIEVWERNEDSSTTAGLVSKYLRLKEIFTSLAMLILFIQTLSMHLITFSSQPRLALVHVHAVGSNRLYSSLP
jgi:hypothetical protein